MSIIYIDKPKGITSFDVCYKMRKILNTKHIGHSGTLDPNASGVMIIASDKDTKVLQFLKNDTKEYIATCTIGIKTDTLDIVGTIVEEDNDIIMPDSNTIINILNKYKGKSKQKPPMYSAIRHNGKHLYDLARKDIKVEVKDRDIEIYDIELLNISDKTFTFKCSVSSGTYIRVLLDDILKDLNIIGTLSDLRRIKVGDVSIDDCYTIEDCDKNHYKTYNAYDLLKNKYFDYKVDNEKDILSGKYIYDSSLNDDYILVSHNNEALAIYKKDKDKYTCVRGLF